MKKEFSNTSGIMSIDASSNDLSYDLTIATVCRNALKFLPRCIKSVQPLYQFPISVEHLLIDGASTDGSVEYLKQQQSEGRITRFISEPDKGLYDAMNKAIKQAHGKIIVFINADDEICPNGVPFCCEPILAGRAEYTAGQALCISSTTKEKKLIRPRIQNTLWRQPYCHQSMFCSTNLLRHMGGFDYERFRIGADTDLMRRLYIAKIPFEAVQHIASHFYTGGISYSPAVRTEVFNLMIHFMGAYCDEARRRPSTAIITLKHLRRYAARRIIQQTKDFTLDDKTRKQLIDFVNTLSQALSPMMRGIIRLQQRIQIAWYIVCSFFATSGKSKHLLHADISRNFVSNLQ